MLNKLIKKVLPVDKINEIPLAENYLYPLIQKNCSLIPIVKPNDYVFKYQIIARCYTPYPLTLHASTSGTIKNVNKQIILSGNKNNTAIELIADGLDKSEIPKELIFAQNWQDIIENAGILGLGGAAFPLTGKWRKHNCETLVVNAIECEPLISCDKALLANKAYDMLLKINKIKKILNIKRVILAIDEQNFSFIAKSANNKELDIEIALIKGSYPHGAESLLLKQLLGISFSKTKPPASEGIICQNIGTIFALAESLIDKKPLIERIVTFAGSALEKANNWQVRFGTPIEHCLKYLPIVNKNFAIFEGGPFMNKVIYNLQTPITANSNCILFLSENENSKKQNIAPCIRCGLCQEVCPSNLLPQQLHWASKGKDLAMLENYHLTECIECACCDAVCPSNIPLTRQFQESKLLTKEESFKQKEAMKAKKRFEVKSQRENLKKEQKEKSTIKTSLTSVLARAKLKAEQTNGNK